MADISQGDYGAWLDSSKAAPRLPHHDQGLRDTAHEHVRDALKAHFDANPGATIPDTQANALLSDYVETHHGVQRGTITDPTADYLRNRINDPVAHPGHEATLSNRRALVDSVGNSNPAFVARDRARDARLRASDPAALSRLHELERDLHPAAGNSYNTLTPDLQAKHREYLAHPEAHPEFQEQLRTGRSGGPSDPGMMRRRGARGRATTMVDGLGHHYDGTVTHVEGGNVNVVQQGWDHERVVGQARENLSQRGHAYTDKNQLRAARRAGPTAVTGTTEISFHDGTRMNVGADGRHTMTHEGWDAAHARSSIGTQMADYTPPPAQATRAERRAAKHVAKLSNGVGGARLEAAVEAAHGTTARTHVGNALSWMETNAPEAHRSLKPKHVQAVVQRYAGNLHTGTHMEYDFVAKELAKEAGKPGALRTAFPTFAAAAEGTPGAIRGAASGTVRAAGAVLTADVGAMAAHGVGAAGRGIAHGAGVAGSAIATGAGHAGSAIAAGAGHVANAGAVVGKKSLGFAKGAGKAVLITGAVGAGLYAVTQMLKSPKPPRRLDNVNDDFGSEPLVFNGGANVGMGTLAVPQVGQQAAMGNWAPAAAMEQGPAVPGIPGR